MIGVRFSLYPMTDAFVPVILDAVQGLDRLGLEGGGGRRFDLPDG